LEETQAEGKTSRRQCLIMMIFNYELRALGIGRKTLMIESKKRHVYLIECAPLHACHLHGDPQPLHAVRSVSLSSTDRLQIQTGTEVWRL
jgi:hypothetical protein